MYLIYDYAHGGDSSVNMKAGPNDGKALAPLAWSKSSSNLGKVFIIVVYNL